MNSLDEQIAYVQSIKNDLIFGLENNPNSDIDLIVKESIIQGSILCSLESLKQKIDTNLDYFVACMHKDEYQKFIDFKEIEKRSRDILIKRYNNRTKAINRFKSKIA